MITMVLICTLGMFGAIVAAAITGLISLFRDEHIYIRLFYGFLSIVFMFGIAIMIIMG